MSQCDAGMRSLTVAYGTRVDAVCLTRLGSVQCGPSPQPVSLNIPQLTTKRSYYPRGYIVLRLT